MSRKLIPPFIALVVVAVAVTGYVLTRGATQKQLTVTAQFEDTIGLYEKNAVSVLGMRVGTITSIVNKPGYVEVKMAIDKGVDLPADVQAVTVNTSILTDRHIELTPAYRNGPKLKSGDVIGLARTRTPVEFDRSLAMIDKLAVALRGDGNGQGPLADFVANSEAAVVGNGPDIKATLEQLSQALRLGPDQGAHTAEDIKSVVDNLAVLTQAAAENDVTIREFGSNLRQVSEILADENLGSGDTGKKVNDILGMTASLLEDNRDHLRGTVSDSTVLTKTMVDMQRELAETFDLLPLVADNTYNVIDSNAGAARQNLLLDKMLFDGQMAKELCNLAGAKQLGCATGTIADFGPDFGLKMMMDLMAGNK